MDRILQEPVVQNRVVQGLMVQLKLHDIYIYIHSDCRKIELPPQRWSVESWDPGKKLR